MRRHNLDAIRNVKLLMGSDNTIDLNRNRGSQNQYNDVLVTIYDACILFLESIYHSNSYPDVNTTLKNLLILQLTDITILDLNVKTMSVYIIFMNLYMVIISMQVSMMLSMLLTHSMLLCISTWVSVRLVTLSLHAGTMTFRMMKTSWLILFTIGDTYVSYQVFMK